MSKENSTDLVKPLLCVDIDNVIANTDEVMRHVIHSYSRSRADLNYDDVICFEYWRCRDGTGRKIQKSEWKIIHEEFTHNHLLEIIPYKSVRQKLEIITKKFDIHLATSRLADGREATSMWLNRYCIPYKKLHFVQEGAKHLIDEDFFAAIEDNLEQGYAFYSKGVRVFLLAHPWNVVGPHSPLKRMKDWEQLSQGLMNISLC